MYSLEGKKVFITGSSSGIGRELALECARLGAFCVLHSHPDGEDDLRKVSSLLEDITGVRAPWFTADLSLPEGPRQACEGVRALVDHVDVLVNNAGLMLYGNFHELGRDEQDRLFMVNARACMILMRLFLEDMVQRGSGRVLNVCSTSAFQPSAHHALYGATKAFIQSLSEGVQQELRGTGVSVHTLKPPYTDTPLLHGRDFPEKVLWYRIGGLMKPDDVARKGVRAFMRGKGLYIPGFRNRFIHLFLPRIMPRRLAAAISYYVLR